MPCFEGENRDKIKVTPAIAKAFTNEMLEHIKGGRMTAQGVAQPMAYGDALREMSEKSGLQVETVNSILRRDPQIKSITKQVLARSGEVRRIRDAAEAFADELRGNAKAD